MVWKLIAYDIMKNIVKSDFKKREPIDGKNQILKMEGFSGIMCGRVQFIVYGEFQGSLDQIDPIKFE